MFYGRSRMNRKRRWRVLPPQAEAQELAGRLKVSPIIAQILLNRGIGEVERGREFLNPSMLALHDPKLLPNLTGAAQRVAKAIREGEKIVIYGDYDVDGITGTAILWHAIQMLGGKVDFYIPHRVEEGYGLNSQAIARICEEGAKLIISVDCGITAVEPAQVAKQRGVDLIITDHHEWPAGGELPQVACIVHPRLPGEWAEYPNPHLCGAGVAFKLAWGVAQQFGDAGGKVNGKLRQFLLDATSLAALATIADVVPLIGENRILTHFGLLGLKQCSLTGIQALLESAGLLGAKVESYDVGFKLGPRLNACGRMDHAGDAVELLTRASGPQAKEIATMLEQLNRQRQATEKQILEQALEQISKLGMDDEKHHAIVVDGEGWHPGVIGIVASRIVDRFGRPAIVVAWDEQGGHGSGRSVPGYHLANALGAMGPLLEGSGGHEMAAGLRIRQEQMGLFREKFLQHAREQITAEMLIQELRLETEAPLAGIDRALIEAFGRLGPFGQNNPKPLLCCCDVELVADPNVVGKNADHLQFRVRQGNGSPIKCIAFKFGEMAGQLRKGMRLDLAVEPMLNTFNGYSTVELQVRDIRVRA